MLSSVAKGYPGLSRKDSRARVGTQLSQPGTNHLVNLKGIISVPLWRPSPPSNRILELEEGRGAIWREIENGGGRMVGMACGLRAQIIPSVAQVAR